MFVHFVILQHEVFKTVYQTLWPDHCVKGTESANVSSELFLSDSDIYIKTGSNCALDTYSAFFDNGKIAKTVVDDTLKNLGVDTIFITGLTLDFGVYWTALDAKELGYQTFVITDATRGIGALTTANAVDDMIDKGIVIMDSTTLLRDKYTCPENWLQCSSSGNCIPEENQCDGYDNCDDGLDENPYKVIPFCCDTIVLSSNSDLVGKWHYKYMGVYVKVACSRYASNHLNSCLQNETSIVA